METTKTAEKYLKALIDLKLAVKYNNKISILQFCKDYGLSKNTAWQITKGGIILNKGKRGRGADYQWCTIPPNIKMAQELLNRVNNVGSDAMKKTRMNRLEENKKQFAKINFSVYYVYLFNFKIFEIKQIK